MMTWNESVVIECFVQCHCKKRKLLATKLNQAWHLSEVNAQKFTSVIASQMVSNLAAEWVNYSASTHQRSWEHARKQKKRKLHTVTHRLREKTFHPCHFKREKVPRLSLCTHAYHTLQRKKEQKILVSSQAPLFIREIFGKELRQSIFFSGFTQLNA